MILKIGKLLFGVSSLKQASELWCAYRDDNDVTGSTMPRVEVLGVGHVSYNGRVWRGEPRDWKPGTVPIYDNGRQP